MTRTVRHIRTRCNAQHPRAHICQCDTPLDEHDDPHWHECDDCGAEWHDDDYPHGTELP